MYFHFGCVKFIRICDYLVFFDPFVQHLFDSVVKVENNTSHYQQFSAKVVALNLHRGVSFTLNFVSVSLYFGCALFPCF